MSGADKHVVLARPGAPLRVLIFHHAGGSAASYLPLARRLPPECEPYLFELPGRGRRAGEPAARNFAAAVTDLLAAVTPVVDRPTLVVGHSLGAILAHSVVSMLPASRRDRVRAVVVSAFTSPSDAARVARHPAEPFRLWSTRQLLAELRDRGGCPSEVWADPDLLAHATNLLGLDLHLADTYVPPEPVDFEAAYHVWFGRDDPYLRAEDLRRWADGTPRPPILRGFRGGHFYLLQESEPLGGLRELVTELVEREAAGARPAAAAERGRWTGAEAGDGSR